MYANALNVSVSELNQILTSPAGGCTEEMCSIAAWHGKPQESTRDLEFSAQVKSTVPEISCDSSVIPVRSSRIQLLHGSAIAMIGNDRYSAGASGRDNDEGWRRYLQEKGTAQRHKWQVNTNNYKVLFKATCHRNPMTVVVSCAVSSQTSVFKYQARCPGRSIVQINWTWQMRKGSGKKYRPFSGGNVFFPKTKFMQVGYSAVV